MNVTPFYFHLKLDHCLNCFFFANHVDELNFFYENKYANWLNLFKILFFILSNSFYGDSF